jgi:hypothetical protein
MRKMLLIVFGIAFLGYLVAPNSDVTVDDNKKLTPEEQALESKKEEEFQRALATIVALKNSLDNPKSFELVDALITKDGTLCVVYRGSNAFGAIITKQHVFTATSNSDSSQSWNRHCAGKEGRSVRHIRAVVWLYSYRDSDISFRFIDRTPTVS